MPPCSIGAELGKANLRGAGFRHAKLDAADLRDARLGGAFLVGASLRGADLRGAYLRLARLDSADLSDANLEGVEGLTQRRNTVASGNILSTESLGDLEAIPNPMRRDTGETENHVLRGAFRRLSCRIAKRSSFPSVKNAVPCRGTEGSNPASSRRESIANLIPADAERPGRSFCREGRGRGASYPQEPARSPDPPGSDPQKGRSPSWSKATRDPLRRASSCRQRRHPWPRRQLSVLPRVRS
jgi:hypothetical protein